MRVKTKPRDQKVLKGDLERIVNDALAETIDLRTKARNDLDRVRDLGTKEEKKLLVDLLTKRIEDEVKKSKFEINVDVVERAAEALSFIPDKRAAEVVEDAAETLSKYPTLKEVVVYLKNVAKDIRRAAEAPHGEEAVRLLERLEGV